MCWIPWLMNSFHQSVCKSQRIISKTIATRLFNTTHCTKTTIESPLNQYNYIVWYGHWRPTESADGQRTNADCSNNVRGDYFCGLNNTHMRLCCKLWFMVKWINYATNEWLDDDGVTRKSLKVRCWTIIPINHKIASKKLLFGNHATEIKSKITYFELVFQLE